MERVRAGKPLDSSVSAGGSLFTPDGDLRQALDAAISSPSGIGVAVDEAGAVRGGLLAADVLTQLAEQRKAEDSERNQEFFTQGTS